MNEPDFDLLPCPVCIPHDQPVWWLCARTSRKAKKDTYRLVGCNHARELADWEAPPDGMTSDRHALASAWNRWVEENTKKPEQQTSQ